MTKLGTPSITNFTSFIYYLDVCGPRDNDSNNKKRCGRCLEKKQNNNLFHDWCFHVQFLSVGAFISCTCLSEIYFLHLFLRYNLLPSAKPAINLA